MISVDRKIKLFIASPILYPPRGGAEIRFWNYVSGLKARNIDITAITGTPKYKKITEEDRSSDWFRYDTGAEIPVGSVNGINVRQIRLPDKTGWRRTKIFNEWLLQLCGSPQIRPDAVQLLTPLPPRTFPWLRKLRKLGIPSIFALTLPPKRTGNFLSQFKKKLLTKLLYTQLECLIVSSHAIKELAAGLIAPERITVIPNGVNLSRFYPGNSEERRILRREFGLNDDSKVILSVGAVHPRKGIDLLLEAWGKVASVHADAHLFLVGPRHDKIDRNLSSFSQKLEALVKASGASQRIHFTGAVDNVEDYYRMADLFVFASLKEGMPNVVLEAMASQLPVVLTQFLGLPKDFGNPDEHYLLSNRYSADIASAICRLLEDHSMSRRLAFNSYRLIKNTMDLEIVLDKYAALYRKCSNIWTEKE